MRNLLSPDVVLSLLSGLMLFGTIILIGHVVNDGTPASRIVLSAAASVAWTTVMMILRIPGVRAYLYQLYYRVSSPTYQIEAGGAVRSGPSIEERALIDLGLVATKKIYGDAIPQLTATSRIIIKVKPPRTIRIDVPPEDQQPEDDWAEDIGRLVEFQLWGFGGKANQVKATLDKEICPFIMRLTEELRAGHEGRNYWVRITTQGKNPFLKFYLRDVPNADVGNFQLDLTDNFAGSQVYVAIQEHGLRIAADAPDALANSVRSYLSSPALAHRDDG